MTTLSNADIMRLYCKELDAHGYDGPASDAEVTQTAMDYATENKSDIDDAARGLELQAQRLGVTTNELVAAVTTLCAYTCCRIGEAMWQLERVLKVVHHVQGGRR
ncbi:MAG: hypothetical protein QG671_3707 [Actinomycetota bacterium]|nr:hypothetical protein [Actinomycetota bacterium]